MKRVMLCLCVMSTLLVVGSQPLLAQSPEQATSEQPELSTPAQAQSDLDLLVSWMSGSFSSKAQSEEDEDFYDIRLRMAAIWSDRSDARWLYVEQAVAKLQDKPYRQRVYRVVEITDGLFESKVFLLPDSESQAGAWRKEQPLAELSPDDLRLRSGCAILMRRRGDTFNGSTLGSLCESTLRGASYATSEVTITADRLMSWDRGFDADGKQVWGAEKSGYRFARLGGLDADEPVAPEPPEEPTEPEQPEEPKEPEQPEEPEQPTSEDE